MYPGGIFAWLIILSLVGLCIRTIYLAVRAPRAVGTADLCRFCGYEITGHGGWLARCPECGKVLSEQDLSTPASRLAKAPALWQGVLALAVLLFIVSGTAYSWVVRLTSNPLYAHVRGNATYVTQDRPLWGGGLVRRGSAPMYNTEIIYDLFRAQGEPVERGVIALQIWRSPSDAKALTLSAATGRVEKGNAETINAGEEFTPELCARFFATEGLDPADRDIAAESRQIVDIISALRADPLWVQNSRMDFAPADAAGLRQAGGVYRVDHPPGLRTGPLAGEFGVKVMVWSAAAILFGLGVWIMHRARARLRAAVSGPGC